VDVGKSREGREGHTQSMGGRLQRSHKARDLTDLSFSLRSHFAIEEAIFV
jgi:hypothetical protein